MSKYLTVTNVRAAASGFDLSKVSDIDLADTIIEAEAMVDTEMNFDEDALGFATGARAFEKYPWNPMSRRVYQACFPVPVKSLTSFAVVVSQEQSTGAFVQANIDTTLCIVNNDLGYVETVSLQVIMYGLTPVLVNIAMTEPFINFSYVAGYTIPEVSTELYDSGDHQTYYSLVPFWDTTAQVPAIYLNGVAQLSSTYTIDARNGIVSFNVPNASAASVSADFTYQIPRPVTQATKGAWKKVIGDRAANQRMPGLDLAQTAHTHLRRRGTFRDSESEKSWQDYLAPYRSIKMGVANNIFRM